MAPSSLFLKAVTVALAGLGSGVSALSPYVIEDVYKGNPDGTGFFDMFTFFTDDDPTNGYVDYKDAADAFGSFGLASVNGYGQAFMGVDHATNLTGNTVARGRASVRIQSNKVYNGGLFILDLVHMPGSICGIWPAFWTTGFADWPSHGEIDIIEGINQQTVNLESLHTNSGCNITKSAQGGTANGDAVCDNNYQNPPSQYLTEGCSVTDDNMLNSPSYGTSFNNNDGGVYVMEWTDTTIKIWNFPRQQVPPDITAGTPDPSLWFPPTLTAGGDGKCDISQHFINHNIVFDTTFCGDYAGQDYFWQQTTCYKAGWNDCKSYVQANHDAFEQAFWLINSLLVYQREPTSTTSSSMTSTTTTSSSSSKTSTSSSSTSSSSSSTVTSTTSTTQTSSSSSTVTSTTSTTHTSSSSSTLSTSSGSTSSASTNSATSSSSSSSSMSSASATSSSNSGISSSSSSSVTSMTSSSTASSTVTSSTSSGGIFFESSSTSSSATSSTDPYSNSSTSSTQMTTSTVYTTATYTITKCPETVTNCPASSTMVVTSTIALYTTVCPVSANTPTSTSTASSTSGPLMTTSTVYTTQYITVTKCPVTVTNCPAHSTLVYTSTYALYTTVCPVTGASSPASIVASSPVVTVVTIPVVPLSSAPYAAGNSTKPTYSTGAATSGPGAINTNVAVHLSPSGPSTKPSTYTTSGSNGASGSSIVALILVAVAGMLML